MKNLRSPISSRISIGLALAVATFGVARTQAATDIFTGADATNASAYTDALNWSSASVPNTANGDTAQINLPFAVTYTPGGDLRIANGGVLEVSSGSFTQVGGNNYIQLSGNGTVLVDGGTFNQGTVSSNPFNVTGTGNAFTISSGTANINRNFNLNTGLTFLQSGGNVNVTGAETDFNGGSDTLSGGMFSTTLITGVNGAVGNTFNISGGVLNLTGAANNGIYGGGTTHYINFTPGSTGSITFSSGSTTVANVQADVNNGVIEYNGGGTGTLSNFTIASSNGVVTISLAGGAVPEPSSVALSALGVAGLVGWMARRKRTLAV